MLFKSNGKILLSSEYLVMDGAKSIALPAKLTQDLNKVAQSAGMKFLI